MTDDKRPREWFIKNSFQDDHANIHGPKTKGCKVIEKSAYDALAKENERLKAERDEFAREYRHIKLANSEMTRNDHATFGEIIEQNVQLEDERDQLKAEVERLNNESIDMLSIAGQEHITRTMAQAEKRMLTNGLTLEREITAMLREALEDVERQCNDSSVVCRKCGDEETLQDSDIAYSVRDAIAKERQMRGE